MSERLDSQIVIEDAESFVADRKFSLKKLGRKPRLTEEKYLNAVLRIKTANDSDVTDYLNMDRTSVYKFRIKYPEVYEKAEKLISEITDLKFYEKYKSFEVFEQLPIIQQWREMQKNRPSMVKDKKIRIRARALFLCMLSSRNTS